MSVDTSLSYQIGLAENDSKLRTELVSSNNANEKSIISQRQTSNPTIVSLPNPQKGLTKPTHDWDRECKPPLGSGFECFSSLPAPFCYANHLSYWTVDENATKFW
eukprot:60670_1